MKINNECKIIEDLLLPYLDGTLNPETKEVVEKHFVECDECKQKLEELKSSIVEEKDNDKKCIDYLKKARKKERIRIIKWIIFAILVVFLFIYFRNFFILTIIHDRGNKNLSCNNMYVQRVDHGINGNATVTKYYYKDGKLKTVCDSYVNDNIIDTTNKYSKMSMDTFKTILNLDFPYDSGILERLFQTLAETFFTSIHLGKSIGIHGKIQESYIITEKSPNEYYYESWYDKTTGLKTKEIIKNAQWAFYNKTSIVKSTQDQVNEFEYQFGTVTDEDVTEPINTEDESE